MAGASGSNSFVDDLIELSGKTDPNEYLKLFVTQQIADRRGFIARMGPEVNITRNELGNALIAGLEALTDVGEVWDTIMCLRDEQRKAEAKLADLQHWLTNAEEEIVEKQKQLKMVENQNDVKFKQIKTDNGTEFRNHELESFCDKKGISQNFSSPYTPEQNGVAKMRNITLIEAARTMLNGSVLSEHF
ncbi:retrovirus-related pol polyprotein from transposon TNT 1-94 [Tanacetum coccineum]